MNAYSFAMTQELQAAIAGFRDDDELRVLILTGAGCAVQAWFGWVKVEIALREQRRIFGRERAEQVHR